MMVWKIALLTAAKGLGLFRLAEFMTRHWIRILCYHGASWEDEHLFRPMLFMAPSTFAQRMDWLARRRFAVLPLGDALQKRMERRLPRCPTVITIDDGWSGTGRFMLPVLRRHGFPATLYVATRALDEPGPVLHIFVEYLLWRARGDSIDLESVDPRLAGRHSLGTPDARAAVAEKFDLALRQTSTRADKLDLVGRLAVRLAPRTSHPAVERVARLMTRDELARARESGVDVQLHTHSHRMPYDSADTLRMEIEANRAALGPLTNGRLCHLGYPSGRYQTSMLPTLAELGIESATTCEPGLVDGGTHALLLPRFLDADDLDPIVFEAEMTGFLELARRCRRMLRRT